MLRSSAMMHRLFSVSIFICFAIFLQPVSAQRLQALHGSPYAGSLAKDYNPAGILNSPDRWDLTVFGLQYRNITNSFALDNIGLLSKKDSVSAHTENGTERRYLHAANTISLLHFRYRLDLRSAFSIGVNLKSYLHAQVSPFYYNDTLNTLNEFLGANSQTEKYYGNAQTSNWMEYSLAYSRVIKSNELGRWQAGIELRIMKSLVGAYGQVENVRVSNQTINNTDYYLINDANGIYGYSANTDELNSKNNAISPFKSFMKGAATNIGLSAGVEYVKYWDDMEGGTRSITDYNWKFSAALLDIGTNKYIYSTNSFRFAGVNPNVYSTQVDQTFNGSPDATAIRDSVRNWADSFSVPTGNFKISNPTRLVINFDKNFNNNFSVNGEAQLQFNSTRSFERINTRETSAIAITPRWEKKSLGVYMPFQFTTEGNFWIGMGLKAGPLVLGLENMGWLLGKQSMPNGGFYLALQIRPGRAKEREAMPCPE